MRSEFIEALDLLVRTSDCVYDAVKILRRYGYKIEIVITENSIDVRRLEKV